MSTTIRVFTSWTWRAAGRTYPTAPFGRIGSFTRYHAAPHSLSTIAPTIRNVVG